MIRQIEAITGRRVPSRYRSMITAQAAQLPEMYRAKEQKEYQEKTTKLREEEMGLAERGQKAAERRSERATRISAIGTGAAIGTMIAPGIGTAIGAGVGLLVSFF